MRADSVTLEGAVFDFETQATLEVVVRTTDEFGAVVRIAVTVEVTDVGETPGKPEPPMVEGVSSRSEREIVIDHLRQRADNEFRVRATNAEGTGEWSDTTLGRARTGGGGGGGGTGGGRKRVILEAGLL